MYINKKNYENFVLIYLVLLYIQFTNLFFLRGFEVFNSLFFINAVILYILLILKMCMRIQNEKKVQKVIIVFAIFFLYCILNGFYTQLKSAQSTLDTIGQMKYIVFFFSIILFCDKDINFNKFIKIIFILEFITSIIYNIHFIMQKPYKFVAYYKQPIGNIILIRNYLVPPLYYFLVTFLFNDIIKCKNKYFSRKMSIVMFISFIMTLVCNLSRTTWILLLIQLISIYISESKMKIWKVKNIAIFLMIVMTISIIVNKFPVLMDRFNSISYELETGEGTFSGRIKTVNERLEYLQQSNQFLFGIGLLSDKNKPPGLPSFSDGRVIYNADSALGQGLLQIGLIGMTLYIIVLIISIFSIMQKKKKDNITIIYSIFILSILVESIISNYLITTAFFSIPVVFTICYRE